MVLHSNPDEVFREMGHAMGGGMDQDALSGCAVHDAMVSSLGSGAGHWCCDSGKRNARARPSALLSEIS